MTTLVRIESLLSKSCLAPADCRRKGTDLGEALNNRDRQHGFQNLYPKNTKNLLTTGKESIKL